MSEEGQGAASHAKQVEGAALPLAQDAGALHDASTAPSQMTGAQPPSSESGKWCCETCTYENYPQSRKCTMCRTPKPVLGEDIFRLQDGASALPHHDPAGAEAVTERLKPLRISSPQGHSSSCAVAKWPCSTCTFENWPKALKCAMCGAPSSPASKPSTVCVAGSSSGAGAGGPAGEGEARRPRRGAPAPDWVWLNACLGVLENSPRSVQAYLAGGGDPARALTQQEVALLNRTSAFDQGHTLVHLAIRFQRQEILSTLLSRISGGGSGLKRSPSYIAPDLAGAIRRQLAASVRHKKGPFPCRYLHECCTFMLPAEISSLPAATQDQLFAELLDGEAQQTLEADPPLINWRLQRGEQPAGCRLHALWNRSLGECLPDAVCQAAFGVCDRDGTLRAAVADSLAHAARPFYARWQAWERQQAALAGYSPTEGQLRAEWGRLVAAAARKGAALHQLHVFVLAHVLRRPLLVYGVDLVRSHRGDPVGYARFQGIYLPLLWEPSFCFKSPLCIGYTRGHFSALVPLEPRPQDDYICRERGEERWVPLTDPAGALLPLQFATRAESAEGAALVRRWVRAAPAPAPAARLAPHAPPLLQQQMVHEWLNHYRRIAQQARGPLPPRLGAPEDEE